MKPANAKPQRLKGLKVMVTRPAHQADKLCQLITAQGGEVILLPAMAIEYFSVQQNPVLKNNLDSLIQQNMAIFVSPNAVQAVALLMQEGALAWPPDLTIAAVGASTASALNALGLAVTVVPAAQFNSEGLLALPALQTVQGKRIILFRGEGGRELLSQALQERGAQLTEAVVYRRVLPALDITHQLPVWQAGGLDIIVCTSNTSIQNLITIIGKSARHWLLNMPLLVISERMALFAQTAGFVKAPHVADNAADAAIVEALLKYRGNIYGT